MFIYLIYKIGITEIISPVDKNIRERCDSKSSDGVLLINGHVVSIYRYQLIEVNGLYFKE